MRCAIYIRVSTKLQETKYSLSAQTTELTAYAKKQGWKIINKFKDVDSGGKLNKKGLNDLLDLVDEDGIDVVLCIDQDRLSRLDTVAWEYLKSTLRENNVKIAEPGSITDLNDEDQEFISDIKNLIARREKRSIVKRMMRGKRQLMRDGKPWGKVPFEYIYDKNTKSVTVNPKYAFVIPMIDQLYLKEQLGLVTIAHRLSEIALTPEGKHWNEQLVQRRLISPSFHGTMEKSFSNGETISIEEFYPPLRTKETFELIQIEREKRKSQYKITNINRSHLKHIHFLRRTLFTCGHCGYKIYLEQHGTQNSPSYYLKHGRKRRISDNSVCSISINTIRIEKNIITALTDILNDEKLADKYIGLEHNEGDIDRIEKELSKLNNLISSQNAKSDRLLDLYLSGSFSQNELDKKKLAIEKETKLYVTKLSQLTSKLDLLKKRKWNYDLIYNYLESVINFDTELTALEKAQLFGSIFPKGTLFEDKVILHGEHNSGVPIDVTVKANKDPHPNHRTKKP